MPLQNLYSTCGYSLDELAESLNMIKGTLQAA